METLKRIIEDWKLSAEAMELLIDFRNSPRYYYRWLMYANDILLEEALENKEDSREALQCMLTLKQIRSLLVSLQDGEIFDVENDE